MQQKSHLGENYITLNIYVREDEGVKIIHYEFNFWWEELHVKLKENKNKDIIKNRN